MEETGEFQGWEVLQNSETSVVHPLDYSRDFEGMEGDSEGVIRSDYFALDSEKRFARPVLESDDLEASVDSDNPSWVDPSSEPRFEQKKSGEFWSDSSSDGSGSQKFMDFDGKHELGRGDQSERGLEIGRNGEIEEFEVKGTDFEGKHELGPGDESERGFGFERNGEIEEYEVKNSDFSEFKSDSGGDEGEIHEEMGNVMSEEAKSGEGEKSGMVWWKLPLEMLKFCVFRVNPVWTFSIAAAVMGFVILVRRLRRIRRKSRSIPLKVTLEGKKASQFMIHAARLNEAFSVVRRVPTIRPLLPAGGLSPWPMMSLR